MILLADRRQVPSQRSGQRTGHTRDSSPSVHGPDAENHDIDHDIDHAPAR